MPSKSRTFISIAILVFLIIGIHYLGWLSGIENFFRRVVAPASGALYNFGVNINGTEEKFSSVDDLKKAYQEAMDAVLNNQVEQTKLKLVEQENDELRMQLNFQKKMQIKSVGSEVIGKNIDPLGNTLIINRGLDDGIKIDDPVVVRDGIVVGKIVKTEQKMSIVRLINDNQSKIAATVMNSDKSMGLVEGGYGISVQMTYIPQNETVNIGDLIVTSGLEEKVPRGLLIGKVEMVEKEAYQPFQNAVVTPSANLEKIRLVSVLLME